MPGTEVLNWNAVKNAFAFVGSPGIV